MKLKNKKHLKFNKTEILELPSEQLISIEGGTNTLSTNVEVAYDPWSEYNKG